MYIARSEIWDITRNKAAGGMIPNIPTVPKCVVRDIAWSAAMGNGWIQRFKRRVFRFSALGVGYDEICII